MEKQQIVSAFSHLGRLFEIFGKENQWPGHSCGLTEDEFQAFDHSIRQAHIYNGWYTEANVRKALLALSHMLDDATLEDFLDRYKTVNQSKTIAIIMAGNVPLVGFHDLLCVLLAGHKSVIKVSSDDAFLTKGVVEMLQTLQPGFQDRITLTADQLSNFDAVIAAGSNNSARYFEHYFGKYPNVIRKSRTSIAVLTGDETDEQLEGLSNDVFDYFGLGCRNVSKVFIPENFNLDRLFKAFYHKKELINHNKYANNYDYHKAIFLMNKDEIIENGFLLLKEDESLFSPLATLYYQEYKNEDEWKSFLKENESQIQVVMGNEHVQLGQSQKPKIDDFADNIDTMKFLTELK